jgi:peptide/nickel transport system ATP-binding protein
MHPYTRGLLAARPRLGAARGERLQTIPGRVPELVDLPRGCPFADRCAHRATVCEEPPMAQAVSPQHQVACVRWAELTG